jgi:hypothetical protein
LITRYARDQSMAHVHVCGSIDDDADTDTSGRDRFRHA